MATKVATVVRYIGTFDRIENTGDPRPYPQHPEGVFLYVSEFGKEVREALSWNNPEITNDVFVTIDQNMIVRAAIHDNGTDKFGRPCRAALSPYFPLYPGLRTYQVKGLPDPDIKEYIWNGKLTFEAPRPVYVVSPVQARIALARAGKLAAVQAACAADPELSIWFEYATSWDSSNPLVAQLGATVGLSADQMTALFETARQITG